MLWQPEASGCGSSLDHAAYQMNKPPQPHEIPAGPGSKDSPHRSPGRLLPRVRIGFALLALALAGCVNVDPNTNETLPRGNQKYKFATVERRAEQLRDGMSKFDALLLLGSPAEASDDGDVWTYLPERPAVLVPTRGLQLEFKNGILMKHGYTTVVLGKAL